MDARLFPWSANFFNWISLGRDRLNGDRLNRLGIMRWNIYQKMRVCWSSSMQRHLLRLVVFTLSLQSVCAFADDDLILPPSLRASPSVADRPEILPKRLKQKNQKKSASTKPQPQAAFPAAPAEQKAPKPSDENPLSFGMKWNANNDPNYGSATTSGLINETNKNLNSQPVGSGGQVGMQYKF